MYGMFKRFISLFCRHKNSEVVCWHWTHGYNDNEIRFLEIELKCKDCGRYFFRYIKDWDECEKFAEKYKDKRWSDICEPVLKLDWNGRNKNGELNNAE